MAKTLPATGTLSSIDSAALVICFSTKWNRETQEHEEHAPFSVRVRRTKRTLVRYDNDSYVYDLNGKPARAGMGTFLRFPKDGEIEALANAKHEAALERKKRAERAREVEAKGWDDLVERIYGIVCVKEDKELLKRLLRSLQCGAQPYDVVDEYDRGDLDA